LAGSSKAKQCLEGSRRLRAAIVPEDEFIQIDLKLRTADPVVSTN
jgi:hypothetical protein